jgi:hypothetical protein
MGFPIGVVDVFDVQVAGRAIRNVVLGTGRSFGFAAADRGLKPTEEVAAQQTNR